jgi:Ca2+-binding RTX toxin-like protein
MAVCAYRRLVRKILIPTLSVLALLAFPALAGAVTQVSVVPVSGVGNVVVVDDDNSSGVIDIEHGITTPEPPPGNVRYVAVRNLAGVQAGAGCGTNPESTVAACEGVFAALVVFGEGGNDKVTMDLIVNDLPLNAEAYGGPGDDELRATPDFRDVPQPTTYIEGEGGNDTIVSGNGADELLGGDGNDTMQSFEGPDVVRGEGGDDSVSAGKEEPEANAADVVDGGPGFDRIPDVDADYNRGFDDNVTVTNDGQPNDGEAGEGDNVISVEKMRVTADQATVVGTEGPDDIFIEANGSNTRGLGGNDRLVAYDGHDTIEGGDGDDYLEGGFGNDVLTGGAGVDLFQGDRTESNVFAIGSDQIFARDGVAEQISCGLGSDTAQVDNLDVVDASCESVDRDGVPGTLAFGAKTLVTLQLAAKQIPAGGPIKIRVVNANGFVVTGAVSGQTTKPVTVSRKRRVKLKAKSFSVAANSRKTVNLKLPAALKRTLKRTGKLSLRLTARVKDPAGNTRTVKRKVTPKLKRKRR